MRLAYVCSDPGIPLDGTKGASVHLREFYRALAAVGFDVDTFVARASKGGDMVDWPGVLHVCSPERRRGAARELATFAASSNMARVLSQSAEYDAIYERLALFGAAGAAYATDHSVPLFVEVNSPIWAEAERYRSLHLRRAGRAIALDVLDIAHRVLVVSEALAGELRRLGVDSAKIRVVPNGVNAALFERAERAERPAALSGRRIGVFIGSLKPWHGIEFLLEAARACWEQENFGLWIVGDGPLGEKVARAARCAPDRVVWERGVDHARIPSILKAADFALAPYPADAPSYFCPLKVVEAIAAGCPLVASDHPCVESLVESLRVRSGVRRFRAGDGASFVDAVSATLASSSVAPQRVADVSWVSKARDLRTWIEEARACFAG